MKGEKMQVNKSPSRNSNQYALKETSRKPGEYHGKQSDVARGTVTDISLQNYKAVSKNPRD